MALRLCTQCAPLRKTQFIQIEGRFPMQKTFVLLTALLALGAQAQTTVKDPWVRGTVAGQKATGLFAQITSTSGGKLVSATSPVAGVVEIHEMVMDGNVMKMRAMPGLELPAGKTVELKPGGYHVMLMDLKQELKAGDIGAGDAGHRRRRRQARDGRGQGARQGAGRQPAATSKH